MRSPGKSRQDRSAEARDRTVRGRLFRAIATMNRNAPLPSLAAQKPTWDKAADLARTCGLNQLADRLMRLQSEGRPS